MTEVSNFKISNLTLEDISIPNIDDSSNAAIEITFLDFTNSNMTQIEDISMTNSQISLMNVRSIQNSDSDSKNFIVNNVNINNVYIPSPRTLVSTEGFESKGNISFSLNSFNISGVEFRTIGEIFNFKHYLENPVVVRNGIFRDIISGSIKMETNSMKSDLINKAIFENCAFSSIENPQRSFINFLANALIDVRSSNFSNITSTNDNSGVISLHSSSISSFTDTNFQNNSAMVASIFSVESKSQLTCVNWSILNNFALISGVFQVSSSGVLSFINSKLHNNFAIQYPLGSILETIRISSFSNWEIYQNLLTTQQEIEGLFDGNCTNLWMLDVKFIQYLSKFLNSK